MSEAPLFSPHWYRVAELRPRLRRHVRVHRQVQRGQVWYLLEDPLGGRSHRLTPAAWAFVGRLDGRVTVDALWHALIEEWGDEAPGQDDIVALVGQLHQADLLQADMAPDVEELFERQRRQARRELLGLVNPLAFRVPLFDPAPLVERLAPVFGGLFRRALLLPWLALVLTAAVLAGQDWGEITAQTAQRLPEARYWLLAWLVYPVLKALHELGHALALRRFGGRTHEMGITLLLLMPVPWVDASAAHLLSDKWQRMAVSAAGILVETTLAALALLLWRQVSPGLVSDLAFVTFAIGGASTVLFNANPLLRFDGYHLLADWLEIPNLAARSARWWAEWAQRHLLRLPPRQPLVTAPGEARWLAGWGLAAWLYRALLMVALAGWLSGVSLWLAAAVAGAFAWGLLLRPAWRALQFVRHAPGLDERRWRVWAVGGGALALAVLLVTRLPLPWGTLAPAVVWVPEAAQVRAAVDGRLKRILVKDGATVRAGQALFELDNPPLRLRRLELRARLADLEPQYQAALRDDPGKAGQLAEALASVRGELREVQDEIDRLTVRAASGGRIVIDHPQDRLGTWVARGDTLAFVLDETRPATLRAVLPQADYALLRDHTHGATAWLASRPGQVLAVDRLHLRPAASDRLPSPALAWRNGGPVLTDPADDTATRPLQPQFVLEARLPALTLPRVGERAWLRVESGPAPLWTRLRLRWEQLMLRRHGGAAS